MGDKNSSSPLSRPWQRHARASKSTVELLKVGDEEQPGWSWRWYCSEYYPIVIPLTNHHIGGVFSYEMGYP
jgi:hypothetical protein